MCKMCGSPVGYPEPVQDSASGAVKAFSHGRRLSRLLMHLRGEATGSLPWNGRASVPVERTRAYADTVGDVDDVDEM